MITLQQKIKDLEDYLYRVDDYRESKIDKEVVIAEYAGSISLEDLISALRFCDYPKDRIIIGGYSEEEENGWGDNFVKVSYLVEETDEEYFERLCSEVTPTSYQQDEFNRYLRLKAKYE